LIRNQEIIKMITHIRGLLIEKSPTEVVIETNGVGYSINISLNTFSKLGSEDNIKLFTHQIIKEDSHSLYGFYEKSERFLFIKLISVSGVGASTARTMLSSLSPLEIISAISRGDVSVIQSIKGIGLKTAQRLILELKDKLNLNPNDDSIDFAPISSVTEAISALEVLGYSNKQTNKVVNQIFNENPGIDVESLIKEALNKL
tara:strand:+ start:6446 stop:7051 length:606 start_codon:yes stop_codon:yes gene_type:complete